jgi:glycerate kinase
MKKNILIAANSFKECADSVTAAGFFNKELSRNSSLNIISRPISDGGDGFLNICREYYNLETLKYRVSTPYDDNKLTCNAGYDRKNKVVYIESADILGLKIIPEPKRHPALLSSKGMGELLNAIVNDVNSKKLKIKKVVLGIGGTGINDLGLGMCSTLGLKMFDNNGNELEVIPKNFRLASSLLWSKIQLPFELEVIIDVKNPLLGKMGATNVYGQQKGLKKNEISGIEKGFEKIINILNYNKLTRIPNELSGAGGGLAAGLILFLNAKTKSSEEFLLKDLGLGKIKKTEYVILTEGSFDRQSLMGKATGCLLEHFSKSGAKIIICCGKVEKSVKKLLPDGTAVIELSKFFKSEKESIKNFHKGIKLASNEILQIINEKISVKSC